MEQKKAETLARAAALLKNAENVLILAHKSPDGDTLGSSAALCRVLHALGKRARVLCSDAVPHKYAYLFEGVERQEFEPGAVVAVDIAAPTLLGDALAPYAGRVDLCIDHHPSNTRYAALTLLDPRAAATCELMLELFTGMGAPVDARTADCLYTGIATDTGCFCYSNTTAATLRAAAELVGKGARSSRINKALFETKSRGRLLMERLALESLEYAFGGRAAVIVLSRSMYEEAGISDDEAEGIPSIPARIEGVQVGVTIKEKEKREGPLYKISLRTGGGVNASAICARFGGGGHAAAAGCEIEGTLPEVKTAILGAVGDALRGSGSTGSGSTGAP